MKSSSLISLASFGGILASILQPRDIANNNCGRAVAGTAKGAAFQSSVKADCSSNVIAYTTVFITPSASRTITLTANVQVTTSSASIATITGSITRTSDILSTETEQYVSTTYSTSSEVDTLILVETVSPPATSVILGSTITLTNNPVSIVTSYTPTAVPVGAAGAPHRLFKARDGNELDARVAASASPTVPAYASACTNFAQYASACSLVGVPRSTSTIFNTLSTSTITVTALSTLTTTILQTLSTEVDLLFTTFETLVLTTTQSSTLILSTATTSIFTTLTTQTAPASTITIDQSTTTTITGLSSVQTATVPVPTFKVQMTPASGTGPILYMLIKGLSYTGTTDINSASIFTLDTANRLVTSSASPIVACAYNTSPNYYMEAIPYAYLDSHSTTFTALNCNLGIGLLLTCTYGTANKFTYYAGANGFFYSSSRYNGYPDYIAHAIVQ